MNVAIIGCGLIGKKRASSIREKDKIVYCCDQDPIKAKALAQQYNCEYSDNWQSLLQEKQIDIMVIATYHSLLSEICFQALKNQFHVLVEKPAARSANELKPVLDSLQTLNRVNHLVAKVGFNHRFHPAFQKAISIIKEGGIGPIMFIRGRYGHGGRLGYDQEWRAIPELSGGGELLDQGMHLIDLSRWIMEHDFAKVFGSIKTYYWNMPVEDNAFMILETSTGQVAHLQVSWTEWKNTFSFEVFGRTGKLHIEGLGGSYGVERLSFYDMQPEMGPPPTDIYEFPGPDKSWEAEWIDFTDAIENRTHPGGNLNDAYAALKVIEKIYQDSQM